MDQTEKELREGLEWVRDYLCFEVPGVHVRALNRIRYALNFTPDPDAEIARLEAQSAEQLDSLVADAEERGEVADETLRR